MGSSLHASVNVSQQQFEDLLTNAAYARGNTDYILSQQRDTTASIDALRENLKATDMTIMFALFPLAVVLCVLIANLTNEIRKSSRLKSEKKALERRIENQRNEINRLLKADGETA